MMKKQLWMISLAGLLSCSALHAQTNSNIQTALNQLHTQITQVQANGTKQLQALQISLMQTMHAQITQLQEQIQALQKQTSTNLLTVQNSTKAMQTSSHTEIVQLQQQVQQIQQQMEANMTVLQNEIKQNLQTTQAAMQQLQKQVEQAK